MKSLDAFKKIDVRGHHECVIARRRKGAVATSWRTGLRSERGRFVAALLAMTCGAAPTSSFSADRAAAYPTKPIRMIVAVPPGGPADTLARIVAPRLTDAFGQTVVIDNRPGANGIIAYETTARAAPDGHTFAAVAAGVVINASLYKSVPYDPIKDFAPITLGITVPNILVVHPSVPANSVKELIALAKAKPLAFASAGSGTSGHLALELFRQNAKVEVTHVPYKGGGPALAEVLAGQVQALFSIALSAIPQVKAGKVRALAITSAKRSAVAPDLPTVAEAGLPGFEVVGWFGWLAPAATPKPIVDRLHSEIVRVLKLPDVRDRLLSQGSEPIANTPAEFGAFMRSEHAKWARVIKAGNIRVE